MLGLETEPVGTVGDGADIDIDAGTRFVLGLRELNDLCLNKTAVALQVKFVNAGNNVVSRSIGQAIDGLAALVIDDRLAELKGQSEEREVHAVCG